MNRATGLTLIELLVSMVLVGIVTAAASRAFIAGFDFERVAEARRSAEEPRRQLQKRITALLETAFVGADQNDLGTYFVGVSSSGTSADGADALVFTSLGSSLPSSYLAAEGDFETNNERYGPQGGTAEIALTSVPLGAAQGRAGLFLREQRPSDGDYTQGGFESLLMEGATDLRFKFFDGAQWMPEWDTSQTARRIPAAVLVQYTLAGETEPTTFVVRLPLSDVTPDNPVVIEGTGQ